MNTMENNFKVGLIKKIMIVMGLLLQIGCYSVPTALKPGAWMLDQVPKDGPPNYKQAWLDGCQSGLASMTNAYYKTFWHFTQNAALRRDPVYYKTWVDTYNFCRHYSYGTLREANLRMTNPEEWNLLYLTNLGVNVFETSIFQTAGPATQGLLLENWGETAGQGFFESMGGELDYTDDMIFNGKSNPVMEWDYTPTHSMVPY
jgi:hypothetical protein